MTAENFFNLALWAAGVGQFLLLTAGGQVPSRLNWKNDLAKLTPFNRKLMWVYYSFIGFTIVSFATLTLLLHSELLRGDRAALALAAFMGVFWALRIVVDFFVFDHKDWPKGQAFVVGHLLLTALFIFLAATYLGLVVWQMWFHI